ncbi:hypothetical protein H9K76_15415 [Diaphorobacter ruginosibacter]|uniref:Uncharacterized protein n=1 Tax=Diaphorobacter ruginosibacter TaxID=1715720 RepID=A0A7G9RK47_9BURK|nr:hypothetical protein [Diaphorobacter ruginosibacter]QNN55972.1 hypothetical protein H9K76_15415 [Diaphorobacter ruginosibacter]
MSTKKNAARVAVQAEPCQKQPDLPSADQAMLTAVAHVQHTLEHLIRARLDDKEWDDKDVDVDFTVDLALAHIRLLRADLPLDRSTFENRWFMAGAAVNLGAQTFSRRDSLYYRRLTTTQRQFEVLVQMVEFVDEEVRYGV